VFPLVDHQLGVFEWVVKAYEGRIDRHGIIDSLADPAVAKAVSATGRRQLITAGIGTEVCEVAPALHVRRDGYQEAFVPMRAARRSRSAMTSRWAHRTGGHDTDHHRLGHRRVPQSSPRS